MMPEIEELSAEETGELREELRDVFRELIEAQEEQSRELPRASQDTLSRTFRY